MIATILNSIGLLLDIWGVRKLFHMSIKGLDKIDNSDIMPHLTSTMFPETPDERMKGLVRDLTSSINSVIDRTRLDDQIAHKESVKWFIMLFLGFIFQLAGTILSAILK